MRRGARRAGLILTIVWIAAAGASSMAADEWKPPVRKGRWDVVVSPGWVTSNTLQRTEDVPGFGTFREKLEIQDAATLGLRAEAHITDRFSFGLAYTVSAPDFEATIEGPGASDKEVGDVHLNWIDADVTWRIMKGMATPFAQLGIGSFNLNDKVIVDPNTGEKVFIEEQHLEYHAAGGYEWLLKDHIVMNAGVRATVTQLDLWPDDDLIFLQGFFSIGYRSSLPKRDHTRIY